jgi:hypothetical protein
MERNEREKGGTRGQNREEAILLDWSRVVKNSEVGQLFGCREETGTIHDAETVSFMSGDSLTMSYFEP